MSLLYEPQTGALALFRSVCRRVADNAIVILDDIFVTLGRCEFSEKAFAQLQEKNEYQVINAHKDSIA